jgi:hypothetical protein
MRLLRQIWKVIDPQAHVGKDTPENTRLKEAATKLHELKVAREKERMERRIKRLRGTGNLTEMTRGERNFCRGQQLEGYV